MRFSFSLIKKLIPAVKSKKDLLEKLNLHSFEVSDLPRTTQSVVRGLTGDAFDVSVPPNRFSDAGSHWGIAAEISAILGRNFRVQSSPPKADPPLAEKLKVKSFGDFTKSVFDVVIKDKKLCRRAAAWHFENLKIGPSPKWMQEVLISCGMRPINNLVDITNYVMLETGQPLHAFDFDKMIADQRGSMRIATPKHPDRSGATGQARIDADNIGVNQRTNQRKSAILIIRRAKKGEEIKMLDGKEYKLDQDILVLADAKDALDIAGIKGGKKAEISAKTKNILLTACNFDSENIYKTSRKLNLITEASVRFSHSLNPVLVEMGINRAAELIRELCGAKIGQLVDVNYTKPVKKIIKFNLEKFNKFIGTNLTSEIVNRYLKLLGFEMTRINADSYADKRGYDIGVNQRINPRKSAFLVEVPEIRQDIETFEDLAEEIARLYGYNRVKSVPPRVHLIPSEFEDQIVLKDKIRKVMACFGLNEVYNYSFIEADSPARQRPEPQAMAGGRGLKTRISADNISVNQRTNQRLSALVEVENPISAQFQYLRHSLAPLLLRNVESNFRFFDSVKIFEIGKVFEIANNHKFPTNNTNNANIREIRDQISENSRLGIALASKNKETFFELKGLAGGLFRKIGLVDYLLAPSEKKEVLKIESGKYILGYLEKVKAGGIRGYVSIAEVDLDILLKLVVEEHEYQPLSKYPSVMRDISIVVTDEARIGDIMQAIQEVDLRNIEDVDLVDEYKDSVTLRIIFHSEDRTLTDKEVNQKMEKIEKILKSRFGAEIR